MLWPNSTRGRSRHGASARSTPSTSAATVSGAGSDSRSWRPGYWMVSTSARAARSRESGK